MKKKISWLENHRLSILLILMAGLIASMLLVYFQTKQPAIVETSLPVIKNQSTKKQVVEPKIKQEVLLANLSHPWEVDFLPSGKLIFSERSGDISILENGQKKLIKHIDDVYAVGEGGLTGMVLDSNFANNKYLYTCHNSQNHSGIDVRVSRFKLDEKALALSERKDIVTGIPSNQSGRHSGCRIKMDKLGNLWVGTGDAAINTTPQDPKSLGGKILRINRDGQAVDGNLSDPFDQRIFNFGHRNTQGLVLFDQPRGDVFGYSVEHGSDVDDEINLLKKGNFGWSPRPFYIEASVPMTDLKRFPDAVSAIWSSGKPTIAPSGAVMLKDEKWGTWNGALAMAVLKDKQLRIIKFDEGSKISFEKEILGEYGRLRSASLDKDGNLYIITDNGSDDKIIKITPSQN